MNLSFMWLENRSFRVGEHDLIKRRKNLPFFQSKSDVYDLVQDYIYKLGVLGHCSAACWVLELLHYIYAALLNMASYNEASKFLRQEILCTALAMIRSDFNMHASHRVVYYKWFLGSTSVSINLSEVTCLCTRQSQCEKYKEWCDPRWSNCHSSALGVQYPILMISFCGKLFLTTHRWRYIAWTIYNLT